MSTVDRVDFDELRRFAVEHQRCGKCGDKVRQEYTGEVPRIAVQFTADDAATVAIMVDNPSIRSRMLCALSLIDEVLADALRDAMSPDTTCSSCGKRDFVAATDNHGKPYVGCAHCKIEWPP